MNLINDQIPFEKAWETFLNHGISQLSRISMGSVWRKVLESTFWRNPGFIKPRSNLSRIEMVSLVNFTYVKERFLVVSVLHSFLSYLLFIGFNFETERSGP